MGLIIFVAFAISNFLLCLCDSIFICFTAIRLISSYFSFAVSNVGCNLSLQIILPTYISHNWMSNFAVQHITSQHIQLQDSDRGEPIKMALFSTYIRVLFEAEKKIS
jgi:hypothetical protein